jgi:hypothetical protein
MQRHIAALLLMLFLVGCSSPTATPELKPTETLSVIYATLPVNPPVLYEEDFSSSLDGWRTEENEYGSLFYKDDQYHIVGFPSEYMNWSVYHRHKFYDGVLDLTVTRLSGDDLYTGTAIFWRIEDENNFYFLQCTGNGYCSVSKYLGGEYVPITPARKSPNINGGLSANRITISFEGDTADIYINEVFEVSITDDSISSGYIGLGVFNDVTHDTEVAFDDLFVYRYDLSGSYTPVRPQFTPTPAYMAITWSGLVDFLVADHTNWNAYHEVNYNCLDFAVDVVANARSQNINAWIVGVNFVGEEIGHAFVAFETSDRGTIYVEPQRDYTYSHLSIGNRLCDDWGKDECWGVVESIEYYGECDHEHYCTEFTP